MVASIWVKSINNPYYYHRVFDSAWSYLSCTAHTHYAGPAWLMDTNRTLSVCYPPCYFIMQRYSRHKRQDDQWYSQPFYSEPGGYKLCLNIPANGSGSGKGSHISVSVFLMKGENDHQLQWPFEHDVTCAILNWRKDENHVTNTIHFKSAPKEYKDRVSSMHRAEKGWGLAKFLPHSSLHDSATKCTTTQYLYQDCLCVQILEVESSN